MQLKLLLPALCKSPQSGSEETYTTLTKPRTDEGKCALSALCVACAHTRTAVWAQRDSGAAHVVCVLRAAHLCVYPAQCSAPSRPSGPVTPLLPHQPVSSPAPPPPPLSAPLSVSLSYSDPHCELMNGWMSLTGGLWGVLFFAKGSSPHRCEHWPFHPIKEWGPTIRNFILILIDVMRRKGTQWALFYMICGHSEKLSKGSQPVCRRAFSAPLHKLFFFHLWIKISFLLKFPH